MATDFVPFATGAGANVTPQSTWIGEATTGTGFVSGIATSADCNKAWRQGTFIAAVVANFVANQLGIDVLDDGNLAVGITNYRTALVDMVGSTNAATATLAASATEAATATFATLAASATEAATATLAASATEALSIANVPTASENDNFPVALLNGNNVVYNTGFYYNPFHNTLTLPASINAVAGLFSSTLITESSLQVGGPAFGTLPSGAGSFVNNSSVATGIIYLGQNSGNSYLTFNGADYVFGGGYGVNAAAFNVVSDARLKDNIVRIADSGRILDAIGGYRFNFKANGDASAGGLAQEVEAVFPEAVRTVKANADPESEETLKALNYNALVGVLIEEVKALRKRVADLEALATPANH